MKNKSIKTGGHNFSQIPSVSIARSSFDRGHSYKTTFDADKLIPFYCDEALPGDSFNCKVTAFARLNTPIVPLMDNMYLDTHWFSVPYRLIWDNWEKFNGAQDNPGDSIDYAVPTTDAPVGGHLAESLADYMGIPTNVAGLTTNALHQRAYNLIWNEWFRDENLQDSLSVPKDDGPDLSTLYTVQKRGKKHDYFTSALPWAQKGDPIKIPMGTTAPVHAPGAAGTRVNVYSDADSQEYSLAAASSIVTLDSGVGAGSTDLYADLTAATTVTINELRRSLQLQSLIEIDARGGTRYIETIKNHFGVQSDDYRLQRSEFLGASSNNIDITPIQQTSSTDATTPQGNLAAAGTSIINNAGFTKSFTEHCLLIGLVSVRADITYQYGLNRMWSRQTRYDYYWPSLSRIGEQAILNKEIYANNDANDALTFGFAERYSEYRYKPSVVCGKFKSNASGTLNIWHLSQDFASLPLLNSAFIESNTPVARTIAVPSEPQFKLDCAFKLITSRPMPTYSTPGLGSHF
tara:strand:+ start:2003 stop:3556 length:1554 start_codon:yes stop_codon:yes gene_type:complete